MAFDNMISIGFTRQEAETLSQAVGQIQQVMAGKAVALTPAQRQAHGPVEHGMEVWVEKVYQYMRAYPALVPQYVDAAEYKRDFNAHHVLNPLIDQLEVALQLMTDTNKLLGSDLYSMGRAFYKGIQAAAAAGIPHASVICADLEQQFPGPGSRPKADTGTK